LQDGGRPHAAGDAEVGNIEVVVGRVATQGNVSAVDGKEGGIQIRWRRDGNGNIGRGSSRYSNLAGRSSVGITV
jgi:hypothetical protein